MRPGTILQEVAADQAIMQLMDARGTLMELKVSSRHDAVSTHAATRAAKVCALPSVMRAMTLIRLKAVNIAGRHQYLRFH